MVNIVSCFPPPPGNKTLLETWLSCYNVSRGKGKKKTHPNSEVNTANERILNN